MSFSGRIDRRVYIYAHLVLVPALYMAFGLCVGAISSLDPTFPTTHMPSAFQGMHFPPGAATGVAWVSGLAALALLVAVLSFTVRRLHDLDFSGWFLLLWAPLLYWLSGFTENDATSVVFEAILIMVPGIAGVNDHGEDPRPRAIAARDVAAQEIRPA